MSLLGGELRDLIAPAVDFLMSDLVLSRTEGAANDFKTGAQSGGIAKTYNGRGFVSDYSDYARANKLVGAKDRKIVIMQSGFAAEPLKGDTIAIGGASYTVIAAKQDPAGATWEVQASL